MFKLTPLKREPAGSTPASDQTGRVLFAVWNLVLDFCHQAALLRPVTGVIKYISTRASLRVGLGLMVAVMLLAVGAMSFKTPEAVASPANTLNFQARLQSKTGGISPDGNYSVRFKIYNTANGGSALWTETYQVGTNPLKTVNGYFTANLGSNTPFTSSINWGQQLYLTMEVGGTGGVPSWDGEMNPRLSLTSVPSAFALNSYNPATGYTGSLKVAQPTGGDQNFVVPDQGAAGTYSLLTTNMADASYIQNSGSLQSGAQFNIGGSGVAARFEAGSFDAHSPGALAIGDSNATSIAIGSTNSSGITLRSSDSDVALRVVNEDDVAVLGVDTLNGRVAIGSISTSPGAALQGSLLFGDGTTNGYGVSLISGALSGNRTITIPDASGTLCLDASVNNCNYLTASTANSGYIMNGTNPQTSTNFNITGVGVAATFRAGEVVTDTVDTESAGNLAIGGTNATSISLGSGSVTTGVAVSTIASTQAFQVQTSEGLALFNIDSQNSVVTTFGMSQTYASLQAPTAAISVGAAGSNYYYAVAAYNNAYTTLPGESVGTGNNSGVTIGWNVVNGATGYRIYRSTTDDFSAGASGVSLVANIANGTTISFTDSAITGSPATLSGPEGSTLALQAANGQSNAVFKVQDSAGADRLTIDGGGSVATTGNLAVGGSTILNGQVQIGSATTDGTQTNLQLDSANNFGDSGACTTTSNQGALYYNTTTASLRACASGSWTDLVTVSGLGLLAFGVMPDSGVNPGDIASMVSTNSSGPCKVSYVSSSTIAISACTAYSGGRKVQVAATQLTGSGSGWYHVYVNPNTGQAAISGPQASETAGIPGWSANAPIVSLADVYADDGGVAAIYDTRVFTTSQKVYATANEAVPLGTVVRQSGSAGLVSRTSSATDGNIRGIVVASSGSASTTSPNIIIVTGGAGFVKTTGSSATVNTLVSPSSTVGYATGASNATAYGNLGVGQLNVSNACTASDNCQYSQLVDINIR